MNVADTPVGYLQFDESGLRQYLANMSDLRARLGGDSARWTIREVGDGNLNLVFLIDGPAGGLCLKQSLPHIRAIESWRLHVERTFFEYSYFATVGPVVGGLIPEIYHYEPELFCIVMEQLAPHVILRRGMIAGNTYPRVATDIAEYVARASYFTSDFAQPLERKSDAAIVFAKNTPLLRITADLVFTDPYCHSDRNSPTTPQLDDIAAAFRADAPLRIAAGRLGGRFLTCAQALIHGDLHSGSVMVSPTDTRVIDPEFALFGPIGFDLGAFVGNLLISYLTQPAHAGPGESRAAVQAWLLEAIETFWRHFRTRFLALWAAGGDGDVFPRRMFEDAAGAQALADERQRFVDGLYADMIGFAAVKMIRRILGFAHVADFLEIADVDRRAACERTTLELARGMLVEPERFATMPALLDAARDSDAVVRRRLG